ncbi:MAG: TetR/AcrR family transcriptional regulator [Christensenellales bacterium]
MMKEAIINVSIKNLQKEGLRFSVDTIARELKISKKTVYKYFADKEELAFAVYNKFYYDIRIKLNRLLESDGNICIYSVLSTYLTSFYMVRKEIFNKFVLNQALETYALYLHKGIWEKIKTVFPAERQEISKLLIDGTFEKLCDSSVDAEQTVKALIKALC